MIKLFGAKLECAKWIGLCLVYLVGIPNWLVAVIEGMEYAVAGGDRAFLMAVSW